jgi:hypothetical protein
LVKAEFLLSYLKDELLSDSVLTQIRLCLLAAKDGVLRKKQKKKIFLSEKKYFVCQNGVCRKVANKLSLYCAIP